MRFWFLITQAGLNLRKRFILVNLGNVVSFSKVNINFITTWDPIWKKSHIHAILDVDVDSAKLEIETDIILKCTAKTTKKNARFVRRHLSFSTFCSITYQFITRQNNIDLYKCNELIIKLCLYLFNLFILVMVIKIKWIMQINE